MKNLTLFLIGMILLLPIIMAATFDNVKSYNQQTKTIKIDNLFGLGGTIATYKLISNTEQCLIDCQAVVEVDLRQEDSLFSDLKFKDLIGRSTNPKTNNYLIQVEEEETRDVPVYKEVCKEKNQTNICTQEQVDTTKETVKVLKWKAYNGEKLPVGIYTLKIQAKKGVKDNMDWIMNAFGQDLTDWAWWNSTWLKKQQIEIKEMTGVTQTNYQVRLNITYNSNMNTTYQDLRFVDSAESTELPYYLWNTTATWALVDVKVPSLTGGANTTIYMYYGNPAALTTSSGANTYVYHTDFESDTLGTMPSGWYDYQGNDHCNITGTVGQSYAGTKFFDVNDTSAGSSYGCGNNSADIYTQGKYMFYGKRISGVSEQTFVGWTATVSGGDQGFNIPITGSSTYIEYDTEWNASDVYRFRANNNSAEFNSFSTAGDIGSLLFSATTGGVSNYYYDQIALANFTFPEPIYSFGLESIESVNVLLSSPEKNIITNNATLNFISNFTGSSLTNATLNIWYYNTTLFNQTQINVTGSSNSTDIPVSNFVISNYTWNVQACQADNNCSSAINNYSFVWGIYNITNVYDSMVYELFNNKINVTFNSSATTVSGTLNYNGTSYNGIARNTSNTEWEISATFVPSTSMVGNNNFTWDIGLNSNTVKTSSQLQNINSTVFAPCNSTISNVYLNFTFKNETIAQETTTASVSSSTFKYYFDDSGVSKTFTFSNATENSNYAFCLSPPHKSIKTDVSFNYKNSISEQRTYQQTGLILTNTTTNTILYLLPTSSGVFVTFQVIDLTEQTISGVTANVTTGGSLVASGLTDDAGSVTFFLNPDTSYTFNFYKSNVGSLTTTFMPTQTSYTITLGSGGATSIDDYTKGISYIVYPSNKTLYNQTAYTFALELGSNFWTVTSFGFILKNSSHSAALASASASSNGGIVSTSYNVGNNTDIIMNLFWVVNGNYTNTTVLWYVQDTSGTGFGLKTFFNHLSRYLDEGMFGMTSFSLAMLIFLTIFIFVGVMSYKFGIGIDNTSILVFIVTIFIYLFDVILGLIPPILGVSKNVHPLTVFMVLFTIGMIIRDASR